MSTIQSFLMKAIRLGPLPYLILAVAIIGAGVVLQMRFTTTDNLAGGRSVFGLMAQIGGSVGLFGLFTTAFQTRAKSTAETANATPMRGDHDEDLPDSAWEARMESVKSRLKSNPDEPHAARPARAVAAGTTATAPRPRANAAAVRMSKLDTGQITRMGMRLVRTTGSRLLSQALRRGS